MLGIEGSTSTMAKVELVGADVVPQLWAAMLPVFEEKGKVLLSVYSEEEIFRLLCHGVMDLWIGVRNGQLDGFALCAWEVHAKVRYYHILSILGDNLKLYIEEGMKKIEKYAMVLGAAEVVVEGRKGWSRILTKRGYAERTVRLRKNVRKAWSN